MSDNKSGNPQIDPESSEIKEILSSMKKIAIIGISPKKERDSNKVATYLLNKGYEIIPVNPGQREILGRECFKTLTDIPCGIDIVNLFLNPMRVPPVVNQAIDIGAQVIWMQLGVINDDAAEKARAAGIRVIMDKCIKIEHSRIFNLV